MSSLPPPLIIALERALVIVIIVGLRPSGCLISQGLAWRLMDLKSMGLVVEEALGLRKLFILRAFGEVEAFIV